jgi:ferric-dicitrate binding protein FerR (iron transport regulator)
VAVRSVRIFIFLFIFCFLIFSGQSYASEDIAKVIFLQGKVQVMRSGTSWWILAKKAMQLNEGDKVKTQKAAAAEIEFGEDTGNIIRLNQDSELTVTAGTTKAELTKGDIFSRIETTGGSKFELRTPTCTIGVAGTGWQTKYDGKRTTVLVFDSTIYVLAAGGLPEEAKMVEPGWKTTISRYQRVEDIQLVVLTRLERGRWNRWIEELNERLEEKGRMDRLRELDQRFEERFY